MTFSLCDYMGVAPRDEVEQSSPLAKAVKRGEGTRGGHIIGHTKSGKPIYAADHASYHHLQESPGYHKDPHDVTKRDTYKVMHAYPGFTAQDHTDAGEAHENINHHTAASAHFSAAAHVGHAGKGDEDSEANWNDIYAWTGHDSKGLTQHEGPLGQTFNDHAILDHSHPKYQGVVAYKPSGITSDNIPHREKNGRAVQASFKDYKAIDHEMAAKTHTRMAKKKRDNGASMLTDNPDSTYGQRSMQDSRHHAAIAQAHNDMAEFLRRKPKKGGA